MHPFFIAAETGRRGFFALAFLLALISPLALKSQDRRIKIAHSSTNLVSLEIQMAGRGKGYFLSSTNLSNWQPLPTNSLVGNNLLTTNHPIGISPFYFKAEWLPAPFFVKQPDSVTLLSGTTLSNSISVTGAPPFSFVWTRTNGGSTLYYGTASNFTITASTNHGGS
jgi:hypothetical protein